ncbi:MAG: hypothetical protein WC655_08215 [Candidatus Hydrogenedentales bacterium]
MFIGLVLTAFCVGWATYTFSLFDVGRFSITLLLLASCALTVSGFRITPSLFIACSCLFFSSILAWGVSYMGYKGSERTFTHLFQAMLGIGVMIGTASVNWDQQWPRFRKMFAWVAVVVLVFGFYQIAARKYGMPLAFLPMTNLQLGSDEGMQRGYHLALGSTGEFTRVSSFLAEPSDLGRFMLWVFAVGLACRERTQRVLLLTVGTVGIMLSQSMGGLLGLTLVLAVVMLLKRDLRGLFLSMLLFGIAFIVFSHYWPDETGALMERAGFIARERGAYLGETGRFRYIFEHLGVFQAAPFIGHGIASFRTVTPPESIVFNGVMLLLIERGLIGAFFFLAPFLWVFLRLYRSSSLRDEVTQTALFVLVVEIYCFTTFAMIYFPPIYFALGFAVSRIRSGIRLAHRCPDVPSIGLVDKPVADNSAVLCDASPLRVFPLSGKA